MELFPLFDLILHKNYPTLFLVEILLFHAFCVCLGGPEVPQASDHVHWISYATNHVSCIEWLLFVAWVVGLDEPYAVVAVGFATEAVHLHNVVEA